MNHEVTRAMIAQAVEKVVADTLERDELLVRDKGATEDEVQSFMSDRRATMERWSDETIARALDMAVAFEAGEPAPSPTTH